MFDKSNTRIIFIKRTEGRGTGHRDQAAVEKQVKALTPNLTTRVNAQYSRDGVLVLFCTVIKHYNQKHLGKGMVY